MMSFRPTTQQGYSLFDVMSALQKAIRRGEAGTAVYFGLELWPNFHNVLWKRLHVISAEDVAGCVTQEIRALHEAFEFCNKGVKAHDKPEGRLFVAKAILLLAVSNKCRDSDHAIIYLYDRKQITDDQAQAYLDQLEDGERLPVPEYAYDCHTSRGKRLGKTKEDFLASESAALSPRIPGLFDECVDQD
jgi:replication-associated recombination protein RarA